MPISSVDNSATIGATEWSLPANSAGPTTQTDDAVLQVWLDLSALASGDSFTLTLYEKVNGTGATQRVVDSWTFVDAITNPNWAMPAAIVMHGWDVTLAKNTGIDRAIGWSLRKIA